MTYVAVTLILLLALREHQHNRQTQALIRDAKTERASLLDRIQHPEVRQSQPVEPVDYEPPQDAAELAHVGQEVPEFIQVGGVAAGDWNAEVTHIASEEH
jgi:hypothetical protein